ncbi:hypothetical protein KY385_01385 [Candidatus Parcubacteria bacterium]|nr:hypothetical protein [Candidatus Parcubacteria bacterium]
MNFTAGAALLSTVLAIYSILPYIRSILSGKTRPHQFSWLVFATTQGIAFFSQFFIGGRGSILVSLTFFVGYFTIFLLSLMYGVRDTSRWDRVLLVSALVTIIVWGLTQNNVLAIGLVFLVDMAATIMLLFKIKQEPHYEAPYPWILAAAAYVFSCLSLIGQPINILYVRPTYGLIGNLIIIGFIYYYGKNAVKPHHRAAKTDEVSEDIIKPI